MRSFARAKEAYDNHDPKSKQQLPQTPMIKLVQEIEFGAVREEIGEE